MRLKEFVAPVLITMFCGIAGLVVGYDAGKSNGKTISDEDIIQIYTIGWWGGAYTFSPDSDLFASVLRSRYGDDYTESILKYNFMTMQQVFEVTPEVRGLFDDMMRWKGTYQCDSSSLH